MCKHFKYQEMLGKRPRAFSYLFIKLGGGLLLGCDKIVAHFLLIYLKRGGGLLIKHGLLLNILRRKMISV